MCVSSSLFIFACWVRYREVSVCGPNCSRGRVIRSSPCWLSTPQDDRALLLLTDDLSAKQMCSGAEEEARWVSSEPAQNPPEDSRTLLTSLLFQNTKTTQPSLSVCWLSCCPATLLSPHSADLKTSVINMIWTTSPENLRSSNSDRRRPVKHKSNKLQMSCVYWNGFKKSSCSFRKILQPPCWFLMQRHLRGRRSQVTSVGVMTS